jgi:hypothetical protein
MSCAEGDAAAAAAMAKNMVASIPKCFLRIDDLNGVFGRSSSLPCTLKYGEPH